MALFFLIVVGGIGILSITAIALIRHYLVVVIVENVSMSPTLEPGDRVLVIRHWPGKWLRRGNIVLVWPIYASSVKPTLFEVKSYIKRILSVGEERFTLTLDKNGENDQDDTDYHQRQEVWHIPQRHIFVCGDNRIASCDSRAWGPLPLHCVLGVVLMKLPQKAYCLPPSQPLPLEEMPTCGLPVGSLAPPFVAQTLNEEIVTLATYTGQAVIFIFIGPSSYYLTAILLWISLAPKAAEAGVRIIFVSNASTERTRHFLNENNMSLPILVAPHKSTPFLRDYLIAGTPAYCFINQQGEVQSSGFLNTREEGWRSLVGAWLGCE